MDGGATRGGGRVVMVGPDERPLHLAAAHTGALGTYRHACKAAKCSAPSGDLGREVNENRASWRGFGNRKGGHGGRIPVRNSHFS